MPDHYSSFQELVRREREGVDYRIRVVQREAPVAIIAPHGGSIEPGTSEITLAIAGDGYRSYVFEGTKKRNNGRLHITSERFIEPRCLELIADCGRVVAIHGMAGSDHEFVEVGGRDEPLRDAICNALLAARFEAGVAITPGLTGQSVQNICNRGSNGAGAQLEITRALRDALREDEVRLALFAATVRTAIDDLE
jgi:phage replication-related protein YjqB (UPF0714/DUF867 family)